MGELTSKVAKFFKELSPELEEGVDAANAGGTKVTQFTRLPPAVVTEIAKLATQILENDLPDRIKKGLLSHRLAERIHALEELYEMIARKVSNSNLQMDAGTFAKVLEQIGPEALLLIPAFADSYRRHIAAGGAAKDFLSYLLGSKNRNLRTAVIGTLTNDQLVKLFGDISDTVFTAGQHSLRSTAEARDALLATLKLVMDGPAADEFFRVLFSKGPNLAPPGMRQALEGQIAAALNASKLPELLEQLQAARIFKFADRSALQGPIGELLALPHLIERAQAIAEATGGPVYILLRTNLDSVRTSVPRKLRPALDTLPREVDLVDTRTAARELEVDVTAITSSRSKEEFTDGIIATFDGKGGVKAEVWTEVKVDRRGAAVGLDQFDRNRESIEFLEAIRTGLVIEVTGNEVRKVPLEEAAKLSGGSIDGTTGALVLRESEKVVERLKALEAKLAAGDDKVLPELFKLRGERLLSNFHRAAKELFIGAEQKALLGRDEVAGIKIRDYGHDYGTVVDTVVFMLATMAFRSLNTKP